MARQCVRLGCRLGMVLAVLFAGFACATDGNVAGADALNPSTADDAVLAVISCDSKNADGSCNKWTCTEDELGSCQTFAEACIKADHHFSGTAKEGTCSRVL